MEINSNSQQLDEHILQYLNNTLEQNLIQHIFQSLDGYHLLKGSSSNSKCSFLVIETNDKDGQSTTDTQQKNQKAQFQQYFDITQECKIAKNILQAQEIFNQPSFSIIKLEPFEISFRQLRQSISSCFDGLSKEVLLISYGLQILKGMQSLHKKSYVLHQLSLENILLDSESNVKLYRFGKPILVQSKKMLEQLESRNPHQQIILPPEAFNEQEYYENVTANIWCFGACMFELAGGDLLQLKDKLKNEEEEYLLLPDCSKELNSILKSTLSNNPNARPPVQEIVKSFQILKKSLWNQETVICLEKQINNNESNEDDSISRQPANLIITLLKVCSSICPSDNKYKNKLIEMYLECGLYSNALYNFQPEDKYSFQYRTQDKLAKESIISLLEKLLKNEPENNELIYLQGLVLFESRKYIDSLQLFQKLCSKNYQDYSPEVIYYLGLLHYKLTQYDEAIFYFSSYNELKKEDTQCILYLGVCRCKQNNFEQGLALINKSIELNKNDTNEEGYYWLGRFSEAGGDLSQAKEYYLKSIKENPHYFYSLSEIGNVLTEQKSYDQAIVYLKQALECEPDDKECLIRLGYAYFKIRDYENSLNYYQRVLDTCGCKDQAGLSGLSVCYQYLDRIDDSLEYQRRLYEAYPDEERYFSEYINLSLKFGQLDKDIKRILKLIESSDQQDSKLFEQLGIIYLETSQVDNAIKSFQRAIELDNKNSKLYFKLVDLFKSLGDVEKAKQYQEEGLQVNPNNEIVLERLANEYYEQKDYQSAIEYYERVDMKKLNPNTSLLYLISSYLKLSEEKKIEKCLELFSYNQTVNYSKLARKLSRLNLLEESILFYQKDLEKNPNNHNSYMNLGNIYRKRREYGESITYYKKCIEIDPNYSTCYLNLGVAYRHNNMFNEAIEAYKKCLELDPKDNDCLYNIGLTYEQLSNTEQALENYINCIKAKPTDLGCLKKIGNIYYYGTEFENAIEYYNRVIQLDAYDVDTLSSLAICQVEVQNYEKATECIEKLLSLDLKNPYFYIEKRSTGKIINSLIRSCQFKRAINILEGIKKFKRSKYTGLSLYYLAKVYFTLELHDLAFDSIKESISYNIFNNSYFLQGNIYLANGDLPSATSSFAYFSKLESLQLGNAQYMRQNFSEAIEEYKVQADTDTEKYGNITFMNEQIAKKKLKNQAMFEKFG